MSRSSPGPAASMSSPSPPSSSSSPSSPYPSNEDATLVDRGFAGCRGREPKPDPPPSAYTNGVVTAHAGFLALRYRPDEALANLRQLEQIPGMFGEWGSATR